MQDPESLYEESERVLVWEHPHYDAGAHVVYLPEGQEMVFFHLDVFYMSAEVLKDILEKWRSLRKVIPGPVFCMLTDEVPANRRLIEKMLGFQYLREMPCTDEKVRNLFVHYGFQDEAQKQ